MGHLYLSSYAITPLCFSGQISGPVTGNSILIADANLAAFFSPG
jgi:hypothetical protein